MKTNKLKSIASLNMARGVYDLIEISHSQFDDTWYLVNNSEEVVYNTQTYLPFNFMITLSSKKTLTGASLVLGNIDRRIQEQLDKALLKSNESIYCKHIQVSIEVNGEYDLVAGEMGQEAEYELIGIEVTKESIAAGLVLRNSFGYNIGKRTFNKNDFMNISI